MRSDWICGLAFVVILHIGIVTSACAEPLKGVEPSGKADVLQVVWSFSRDRQALTYVYRELPENGIEFVCIMSNEVLVLEKMKFAGGFRELKRLLLKGEEEINKLKTSRGAIKDEADGDITLSVILEVGANNDAEGERYSATEDRDKFCKNVMTAAPSIKEVLKVTTQDLPKGLRGCEFRSGPHAQTIKKDATKDDLKSKSSPN